MFSFSQLLHNFFIVGYSNWDPKSTHCIWLRGLLNLFQSIHPLSFLFLIMFFLKNLDHLSDRVLTPCSLLMHSVWHGIIYSFTCITHQLTGLQAYSDSVWKFLVRILHRWCHERLLSHKHSSGYAGEWVTPPIPGYSFLLLVHFTIVSCE